MLHSHRDHLHKLLALIFNSKIENTFLGPFLAKKILFLVVGGSPIFLFLLLLHPSLASTQRRSQRKEKEETSRGNLGRTQRYSDRLSAKEVVGGKIEIRFFTFPSLSLSLSLTHTRTRTHALTSTNSHSLASIVHTHT